MSRPFGAALVTGAASGIGRAVAVALAARGFDALALFDLDPDGLAETAGQIDAEVLTRVVDVGDASAMEAGFEAAIGNVGRLGVVVNNAAMMTPSPGFPAASLDVIDRVVATNVRSVLLGVKFAHEHMRSHGGGSIVSTASGAGKVGLPTDPLYAATKAAVINLTRSCAPGFALDGVRINAVCPGVVDTPMLQADGQPADLAELLAGIELLSPETIANAVVDLALDVETTGATPSIHNR